MTVDFRTGKPDHSVVWDHTRCWHVEPGEDDELCSPTGNWVCRAPAGSYCVFGCEECSDGGWTEGDDDQHCSNGHLLAPHECWVLPWIENLDASDTYSDDGPIVRHHDGPVVVDDWGEDYLTWRYPTVTELDNA